MATIQRVFDTLDVDSQIDGGSAATVDNAGTDSEVIDISQWEGVHCEAEVDFTGTTDDLVIEVLSSNDGEFFDTIPLFSFTVDKANSEDTVSWIVTSVYNFKVKFKSSGATDTISVLFRHRRWRWETA